MWSLIKWTLQTVNIEDNKYVLSMQDILFIINAVLNLLHTLFFIIIKLSSKQAVTIKRYNLTKKQCNIQYLI